MSKNLLIVESPAKAKTIEKILGENFTVKSSYGHIRDLPKGDTAININNGYTPNYQITPDKHQVVNELKQLAKSAQEVWLATDEDREGEAIAWHLCQVLNLNVPTTKRIVFNEITKTAIQKAVKNPRTVNQNLVDAQQARRVLDRLVGFEISPILWKKISRSNGLSAGRVQSVAVRLVVEREREIRECKINPFFKISAIFTVTDPHKNKTYTFKAELPKTIENEADALNFLQKCQNAEFSVTDIQVKPAKKSPSPPFTTSTLQQEASRKLGFSVQRTMIVAQKLYEAGHISYMRTDSTNLSEEALQNAAAEICQKYNEKYLQTRRYKTKSDNAQEAHEAIRPTYFNNHEAGANSDEKRLYSLIWKRALASQMADAQLERTTVSISISTLPNQFLTAKGEVILFEGFLALYTESKDEEEENSNNNAINPDEQNDNAVLPPLKVNQPLNLQKMQAVQRFNRPAPRYTEASLVKKLEELSIGRPSTYAPTISTIQQRNYVVKEDREGTERNYTILAFQKNKEITRNIATETIGTEKGKMFPTDIGILVNDFLVENFNNILNYNFTADLEKQFDEIAEGQKNWTIMLDGFYKPFHENVENTLQNAQRITGERQLGNDPKTNKPVLARLGRFGAMVQIGSAEDEEKQYASIRAPHTIENITLEQALEMFKLPRVVGSYENADIKANEGRFGPYIAHASKFYSLPKNETPFGVTLETAIQIIENKRKEEAEKLIKNFEEHNIQVLNGRFGPYIKHADNNIKIPKGKNAHELTLDECLELVKNAPPPKSKPTKKTTTATKTTTPKSTKTKKA